ncbi:hypothetical protein NX774_12030 [Massilia agilis]|uniref:Uncharacterized protein n=1 Tax=Massilia agilis TaxID=1811226 RepID=A0ABT2DBE4_9BURK|nr:hypothetical protein [Massilia agilis]MCS0808648.1 hypothetical protein [Massilia agilis]
MRIMRGTIYRDYTVVVNPTGAPEGRFRDAFSVHKHVDGEPDLRVTVYQRSISEATEYNTEKEAVESALKHAGVWIDGEYP